MVDRGRSAQTRRLQVQVQDNNVRGLCVQGEVLERPDGGGAGEVGGLVDGAGKALTEERMVLDDRDPDHRGTQTRTLVPSPGADQISAVPPTSSARARMD